MTRIIRYLEASGSQTAGWYLYVDGTLQGAADFTTLAAEQFGGKETIWLDGATPSGAGTFTGGNMDDTFLAKSDLDVDVTIHDTLGANTLIFDADFVATKVELVSVSSLFFTVRHLEISFASGGTTRKITVNSLDTIKFQLGADGTALTAADFVTMNPAGFTVVASNVDPVIADETLAISIVENTTAVTTIAATDADSDDISFGLSGADAALFEINKAGELTFKSAPDFEARGSDAGSNTYVVVVTASDGKGGSDDITVTVAVTDVEEPPVLAGDLSGTVKEAGNEVVEGASFTAHGLVFTFKDIDDVSGDDKGKLGNILDGSLSNFKFSHVGTSSSSFSTISGSDWTFRVNAGNFSNTYDGLIGWLSADGHSYSVNDIYTLSLAAGIKGTDALLDGWQNKIAIALVSSVVVVAPGTPLATGQLSVDDEDTDDAGGFAATDLALQVRVGSTWATANTDTANSGAGLKIDGTYGALYIKSDGAWSYELDNDDADTQALTPDDAVSETFELRVTDGTDAPSATKTLTITVQGSNDAPIIDEGDSTDDGALAVNVAEGTKAVATLTATDPDGDGLTYALSGADADLFTVSGTGVVTFVDAPDFSSTAADNTKTFTLTVTDDSTGTLTDSVVVTVTITSENDAPIFVDASDVEIETLAVSVVENTAAVATLKATDANAGDSLTYSVTGGADMGLFEITANTSNLVFKSAPDFEARGSDAGSNTYVVEVTVTDGTDTDTLTITVTVTNENEAGTVGGITGGSGSAGYAAVADELTAGAVTDPDGAASALAYQWQELISGTWTDIASATTSTYTVASGDGGKDIRVVTTYTAGGFTNSVVESAKITIDTAPTGAATLAGDGSPTVNELLTATNTIADSNGTSTLTYAWTKDGTAISGAEAATYTPTAAGVYAVIITATDDTTGIATTFTSNEVTVAVPNVAPTFVDASDVEIETLAVSVAENTAAVATLKATDANAGDSLTYSVTGGRDMGLFAIDENTGALTFKNAPDFETPRSGATPAGNEYIVVVTVTDDGTGTLTDTVEVTITVTDENDVPPIITSGATGTTLAENTEVPTSTIVYDADGTADVGTIVWSLSGTDAGLFNINSSTGAVTFKADTTPDYETNTDGYSFDVTATVGTQTATQAVTIAVTNAEDPPVLAGDLSGTVTEAGVEVVEGTSFTHHGLVFTFKDIDDVADNFHKTTLGNILDGTLKNFQFVNSVSEFSNIRDDVWVFQVNVSKFSHTYNGLLEYLIDIGDYGVNGYYTASFAAGITGATGLPSGWLSEIPIALVSSVVVAAPGTPMATGQLSVTDDDAADAGGFAATDLALQTRADSGAAWATANTDTANDGKGLKIDGTYGALYIKSDGSWSYELDNDDADTQALDPDGAVLETFELRVTDGTDAPSATKTLTITVQGANDSLLSATASGGTTADGVTAISVAENTQTGDVTTITVTNPGGAALTYSLLGADKDLFTFDEATGLLRFTEIPDYEFPTDTGEDNVYNVTVRIDDGAFSEDVVLAVTVTDVGALNQPSITSGAGGSIKENLQYTTNDFIYVAEGTTGSHERILWSLKPANSDDAALFDIDPRTGKVTFKTATTLDYESDPFIGSIANDGTLEFRFTIVATVGSGALTITSEQNIIIKLENLNDVTLDFSAAVEASATVTPIVENTDYSSTPTDVAELTATDDSGATVSYKIVTSLTDNTEITGGVFSIFTDANGRKLLRYTGPSINHEATASLMAFVEATSSDGDTIIKAIEVAVTNANDAPILLVNGGVYFNADETSVTLTPTALLVSDEDSSNTITFTLVAAPVAGTLALSGTALAANGTFTMADIILGKVTYTPPSTPIDTSFTFTYSDGTVTSEIKSFVVTVREKTAVEEGDNTLDLSNITEAQEVITDDGQDKIIDSKGDDYIETGRGDDTVDLSSGGADTIAYNVDGGEDGLVGTDGNTRVTGFTRDEDKILFKTAESAITTLNAFLIDGQGELNDGFADDKFIVTIDYEIAEGPVGGAAYVVLFTGMTFHFRESAVYGGNKLSMPVFEIEFDTPMTTTELFAVSGGRENLDGDHGVALKTLVKLDDNGEVEENYVANILGADSIDFTRDDVASPVQGDGAVRVTFAGIVSLSEDNFKVTDSDTPDDKLIYTPSVDFIGVLGLLLVDGQSESSFTQADLKAGDVSLLIFAALLPSSIDFTVTDGGGNSITVTLQGNEAPIISTNAGAAISLNVLEGTTTQTPIAKIVASDADGDSLTYSLSGADAADFSIDANGLIKFVASPSFATPADSDTNNVYNIVVTVSDGTLSDTIDLTISVLTATGAPAPTISSGATATFAENTPFDVTKPIYTAAGSGSAGAAISWSLKAGGDAALFDIDPSTGKITFKAATTPDFETDPSYAFTVVATTGALSTEQAVTITITNVADNAPRFNADTSTQHLNVVSGNSKGRLELKVEDADGTDIDLTYSLLGEDASQFEIYNFDNERALVRLKDLPVKNSPTDANGDNSYRAILRVQETGAYDASGDQSDADTRVFDYTGGALSKTIDSDGDRLVSVAVGTITKADGTTINFAAATSLEVLATSYIIVDDADDDSTYEVRLAETLPDSDDFYVLGKTEIETVVEGLVSTTGEFFVNDIPLHDDIAIQIDVQ